MFLDVSDKKMVRNDQGGRKNDQEGRKKDQLNYVTRYIGTGLGSNPY